MTVSSIITSIICISFFHLSLISISNPLKVNGLANIWFCIFAFSAGCMILNSVLYQIYQQSAFIKFIAINELSRFIIAPALYLSITHYTSPDKRFKPNEFLHFIPFALFLIYLLPFILFKNYNLQAFTYYFPYWLKILLPFLVSNILKIQLLFYWLFAFYTLKRHEKNIKIIYANVSTINLRWLQNLLFAIAFMIFLWLAEPMLKANWINLTISILYLAGVLFTGYFLLSQKEIYPFEHPQLIELTEVIYNENIKSKTNRFSNERLAYYKNELSDLMEFKKVYLNSELDLPGLAVEMKITTHDLSFVLNQGFRMSFFHFVNAYRIAEAKKLLVSQKHKQFNILGIAYSAGFNSKTTFNTAFKKETGLSPTQFIRDFCTDK